MATTIQWRLKKKFRKAASDNAWRKYAEVQSGEVAEKLASFNANDVHFEYREAPKKEANEPQS